MTINRNPNLIMRDHSTLLNPLPKRLGQQSSVFSTACQSGQISSKPSITRNLRPECSKATAPIKTRRNVRIFPDSGDQRKRNTLSYIKPDPKIKLQTQRRQFEMAVDITREQWEMETERLCPSALAFNAYADLERYIVENTDLTCTYQSVSRGKSDYATFLGQAGNCNVIQVYKGQCQLNWRWKLKVPGTTDEERAEIDEIFEEFRVTLNGKEDKGWETVKVLRLGEEKVQEAVKVLADKLMNIIGAKEEK